MNSLHSILASKIRGYVPKVKEIELIALERRLKDFNVGFNKPLELYYKDSCIQSYGFSLHRQGYINVKDKDTGKTTWLHRIVYRAIKGEIAVDLVVRHTCHNKGCLNPEHLILGTAFDNKQDDIKDNRTLGSATPGERHHNARLTAVQVRDIFLTKGMSGQDLARKYQVDPTTISRIKKQVDWVIVTQDLPGSKFLLNGGK